MIVKPILFDKASVRRMCLLVNSACNMAKFADHNVSLPRK